MIVATWDTATQLEPGLIDLQRKAEELARETTEADYWHAYEYLKRDLFRLVGWGAERPELRTSDFYIVGHRGTCGRFEAVYSETHSEGAEL